MRPLLAPLLAAAGCTEPPPPDDFVDLDAVLQVWADSLAPLDATAAPATARPAATQPSPVRDRLLVTALDAALQGAGPRLQVPGTLAVHFESDGALQGFVDQDGDRAPTPGEDLIFRLVADLDRRRLLAVDLQHPEWMRAAELPEGEVGLATAYALGRMRHAQEARGVHTDSFGQWRIAPEGYHRGIAHARRHDGGR